MSWQQLAQQLLQRLGLNRVHFFIGIFMAPESVVGKREKTRGAFTCLFEADFGQT